MEKGDLMSATNKVKHCLSQTTEHGQGSPLEVIEQAIESIAKQGKNSSLHKIELKEHSLRRSVIMILIRELKALDKTEIKGDELQGEEADKYYDCAKWFVRLSRVLTSREVA